VAKLQQPQVRIVRWPQWTIISARKPGKKAWLCSHEQNQETAPIERISQSDSMPDQQSRNRVELHSDLPVLYHILSSDTVASETVHATLDPAGHRYLHPSSLDKPTIVSTLKRKPAHLMRFFDFVMPSCTSTSLVVRKT